ncbi:MULTISPECIES: CoA transferase [unclassified Variovorax]|uniref:CoA transferase n=1 Tax=unclassified Variovorax TaxID=663243 RepID=UPI00257552F1|nr:MULTISPECIES: CoA transferase [unclassified Variovorax]MDM0091671.1 CoA transferase [Variovorax sp. J22G40]MDM0146028.1 CoA transferase [Variovorax sp. J2P1-31]
MTAAHDLRNKILGNLENPLKDCSIDLHEHLRSVLALCSASEEDIGGRLTFSGADPIVNSRLPFGAMSAISLAAKAVMVAKIWRERSGESQDIHVDVPKAFRRFTPFWDKKWELVNGFPGKQDPYNPFYAQPIMHKTKDNKWVMPLNIYPSVRQRAMSLLKASDPASIAEAISRWDGEALERAANEAGIVMALGRPIEEVVELDAFSQSVGLMPLIEIEKVADGDPIPFKPGAKTPLDGVRALGTSHVIAGPAIGRSLALHGADVLNIIRSQTAELDLFHFTSHVGVRNAHLELQDDKQREQLYQLLSQADIYFNNHRQGWRERFGLSNADLRRCNPNIIDVDVFYAGETGPWSNRTGFDISAGLAWGLNNIESPDDKPAHPPHVVICDYPTAWLAATGAMAALYRRSVEGGSYRVKVSLGRVALWLPEMGIFDRAFAKAVAGSGEGHLYPDPEPFTVDTPMGTYTGVSEMVEMSRTPGSYRHPLTPIGSWRPAWL